MILNIKQITNKNLLYSTKKYTQYIVITYKEKNLKKYVYMYILYMGEGDGTPLQYSCLENPMG